MRDCPTCHGRTPEGGFCVRCGAPLGGELENSRHRNEYAVAPGEHRYAPWLVSTLFPQLPRHSERHFYAVLTAGAAVVAVLGALRLFPVALIVAAALMPLLTVIYFYDVDIYEGEPAWAMLWTVGWGALTGVGTGLFAKAIAPSGQSLIDKASTAHVVSGGLVVPAIGVLLAFAGPLVLLRYRLFNDALDGVSFGAASAATFASAETIVVAVNVLKGGLRPLGATTPWVERLLALAIATPVLSMAAIGAAEAAVWLRYRAPVEDRGTLGLLGSPPVAFAFALVLVIAGAIGETFMTPLAWLVSLIVLDLVAIVLLRRALHVGLLEEATEGEVGPEAECRNCHAQTATHTFCGHCGVALKALPKAAARSTTRRTVAFAAGLAVIVGVGFAVGTLGSRAAPQRTCTPGTICGRPPIFAHVVFAFPGDTPWQSKGLGFSLRFPSSSWSVASSDADDVELEAADGSVLQINGAQSSQVTPQRIIKSKLSLLSGQLLGMTRDTNSSDALLGTGVGLVPGPNAIDLGTVSSPQGPQTPVTVAVSAASGGGVTIVATLITASSLGPDSAVANGADDIVNSVQFPAQ